MITYPFPFLSAAAAFDVASAARQDEPLAQTAMHFAHGGRRAALAAAVPGLIDYLTVVPEGRPQDTATKHMLSNVSALACFAAAGWAANANRVPNGTTIGLELLGTALLSIGGWLGGSLSYHHQIGDPEEPRALPRAHRASGQE